jgi:hypothetical protein
MALGRPQRAQPRNGTGRYPEYREHAAAAVCSGWRHQCPTTGAPVGLANLLGKRPLASCRRERLDSVSSEHTFQRQVGDVGQIDLEPPHVARQPQLRRYPQLRRVAVPLRPGCLVAVGEIERSNDVAALPATVGGFLCPNERIGSRSSYAPPGPGDADDGRDGLDQEKESFSSSATRRDTSLYRPSPRASSGRSSSSPTEGFWSQMAT